MRSRPKHAFLDHDGVKRFAHRGGNLGPQNTIPAFGAAWALGFEYFETDVTDSTDNTVYAFHGSKTKKEAQATGIPRRKDLHRMSDEQIARIRIDGEPIPTLRELLDVFPDARVNIDAKTNRVARHLPGVLLDADAVERVCIGSFWYPRTVGIANELGGQEQVCTSAATLGMIALMEGNTDYLKEIDAACLQVPMRWADLSQSLGRRLAGPMIDASAVECAHDAGLELHVWTINDKRGMREAVGMGVDGIITDEIELLNEVLAA